MYVNEIIKQQDNLEIEYIDKLGLLATLQMLLNICDKKSQHLQENWQDKTLDKEWERKSNVLHTAISKLQ